MAYSRAFFDLQLTFAGRLAAKFDLPLASVLYDYTTFSKSLIAGDWTVYCAGLDSVPDAGAWTYAFYCRHQQPDPAPADSPAAERPRFGCFSYEIRDETVIRPHFANTDRPEQHPLSAARGAARCAELGRMFASIREQAPQARTVLGNSWMYNLEAYRRLYPPAYTRVMDISSEDEFQFLALWGQCFDRNWQVRPASAAELLRRVDALDDLAELQQCFPYQILQPHCAIDEFYAFFRVKPPE